MKHTPAPNSIADLQNALRLHGKLLPETDAEIDEFIAQAQSAASTLPQVPPHLTPAAIAAAVSRGTRPQPIAPITEFPRAQTTPGIEGLKMAARNGEGPLSEETIQKMKEAQQD